MQGRKQKIKLNDKLFQEKDEDTFTDSTEPEKNKS